MQLKVSRTNWEYWTFLPYTDGVMVVSDHIGRVLIRNGWAEELPPTPLLDLDGKKRTELLSMAKELGIKTKLTMTKADVIQAIEKHYQNGNGHASDK